MLINTTIQWVEAWVDSGSGAYILLLRGLDTQAIELVDPQENSRVITTFDTYENAKHWLNEDEYDLLEGRYALDS